MYYTSVQTTVLLYSLIPRLSRPFNLLYTLDLSVQQRKAVRNEPTILLRITFKFQIFKLKLCTH